MAYQGGMRQELISGNEGGLSGEGIGEFIRWKLTKSTPPLLAPSCKDGVSPEYPLSRPLIMGGLRSKCLSPLPPFVRGGADVVNTLSSPPDKGILSLPPPDKGGKGGSRRFFSYKKMIEK